jgi:hypothetical protein
VIVFGPDGKAEEFPWAKDHPSFNDHMYDYSGKNKLPGRDRLYSSALVSLYNPALNPGANAKYCSNAGGGLQLDYAGNVYVGTGLVPLDFRPPPGHEKDPAMVYSVGSVIKFPKEGGQCMDLADGPPADKKGLVVKRQFWPANKVFAENATAVYPGLGMFAGGLPQNTCSCRHPTFSLDGHGRLAIPNSVTFKVRMLDNAGNEILQFGKYGNMDAIVAPLKAAQESLPKDDPLRKLEISPARPDNINALLKARPLPASEAFFGWPQAVAASETALYVADVYNHCIVRLLKTYAAESSVDVK